MYSYIAKYHLHILLFVLFSTLIGGTTYALFLGNRILYHDETQYLRLAQHLVEFNIYSLDGTHFTAWRPPGYPFFLALFSLFHLHIVGMRIANFALLMVSITLIHFILKRFSKSAAGVGVIMVTLYPLFFYAAGTLYPQTLASALFLGIIALLMKPSGFNLGHSTAIGALYGLLILTIPPFIFPFFLTLPWVYHKAKSGKWVAILIMFLACSIVTTPWMIRNYTLFHTPLMIASNGGLNLYLGNSEGTDPAFGVNPETQFHLFHEKSVNFSNEIEADRYYRNRALEFIWKNKEKSLKLYALKFINYFNFSNRLASQPKPRFLIDLVLFFSYGLMLSLVAFRLLMVRRIPLKSFEIFLLILYVGNGIFSAIFFTRIRFRIPFDFLLILLNAQFITYSTNRGAGSGKTA